MQKHGKTVPSDSLLIYPAQVNPVSNSGESDAFYCFVFYFVFILFLSSVFVGDLCLQILCLYRGRVCSGLFSSRFFFFNSVIKLKESSVDFVNLDAGAG
ncbi:TPA: hypothetical protein ACGTPM_004699 [Salmonella enterica]